MKRVITTHVATTRPIAMVSKTALVTVCGGRVVRLIDADPSPAVGTVGTDDGPTMLW
jgi:hypothetical protein